MCIQVLFACAVGLLPALTSWGSTSSECYDFAREIREGPAHFKTEKNAGAMRASGELPSGAVWAVAQSRSPMGVQQVLEELASHEKTKSSRVDEMEIDELADPHFLRHQKVKFEVNPFPLFSVKWTEDWAFTLLDGTRENPRHALVVYEKTDGTSYIKHLCGAYELRALPSGKTEIFLYEETKATSRTREDTLRGLISTLDQLR